MLKVNGTNIFDIQIVSAATNCKKIRQFNNK